MNLSQFFTKTSFKAYQKWLKTQKLPQSTIKRKLSSLRRFDHWLKKPSVPQGRTLKDLGFKKGPTLMYKRLLSYLYLSLLVLFSVALGIYGYQQVFKEVVQQYAYPQAPSPTTPNRLLSFQARLTDSSDNPISVPTDFRFLIYNADAPASGSAKLWEEQRYIDPDQDGIFSVTLGTETAIPTTLFTDNADLWLGVTVETDPEATPRQRIATVGYALNAETLQGFPPSASASADQIPVLTQEGDLVLAAANPMVYSSSGTFSIKGQILTLTTATGTGGDIQIAPDGTGNLDINLSSTAQNAISITNAGQTSGDLIHAYLGNDTATGNLLTLSSGASETNQFTVSRTGQTYIAGNLGIGTTNPGAKLEVGGQVKITGGTPGANKVLTSDADGLATWSTVGGSGIGDDTLDFAQFEDTLDLDANLTLNQAAYTWTQNFTGTTATGLTYNANSLTSGSALALASTATGLTGDLATITLSGSNAANTGSLLSLTNSGTANTNTTFYIKHYATGTNNLAMRVDDVSGDTSPFVINGAGFVGIGTTSPNTLLHIYSATNNDGFRVQSAGTNSYARSWYQTDNAVLWNIGARNDGGHAGGFSFENNYSGWASKLFITTAGNIGIGTTGPGAKLDVAGAIKLSGTDNIILNGNWLSGDGGDEGVFVSTAGNVGIGTTAPGALLHLSKANTPELRITATSNANPQLSFFDGSTSKGIIQHVNSATRGFEIYADTGVPLTLGSNGVLGRLVIDTSGNVGIGTVTPGTAGLAIMNGNVGIGTTNPAQKLEVAGTAQMTGFKLTTSPTLGYVLTSDAAGVGSWTDVSSTAGPWTLVGNSLYPDAIAYNVGIGTSTPLVKLHVVGDGTNAASFMSGNVGIGTTAPGALLSVGSTSQFQVSSAGAITAPTSTNTINSLIINSGALSGITTLSLNNQFTSSYANTAALNLTGDGAGITFTGTGVNQIITAASQHLALMPGGNVGIGTTDPSSFKLETAGSIGPAANDSYDLGSAARIWNDAYVDRICFDGSADCMGSSSTAGGWTDGGSSVYLTTSADNVGIGTSTPLVKLHVVGDGTNAAAFMSGNVGIGTTSPVSLLHVAATAPFVITTAGQVGIGTTGPGQKLTIASGHIRMSSGYGILWPDSGGNQDEVGLTVTSGISTLYANNAAAVTILESGNVGIGTAGPTSKLHIVAGNIVNTNGVNGLRLTGTSLTGGAYYTALQENILTTANTSNNQYAYVMQMLAGATESKFYSAGYFINHVAGTGTGALSTPTLTTGFNIGVTAYADATTVGHNVGVLGEAEGSSALNIGVLGQLNSNTGTAMAAFVASGKTGDIFRGYSGTNQLFTIQQSGNVGIGTTGPLQKIDVRQTSAGSVGYNLLLVNEGTTNATGVGIKMAAFNSVSVLKDQALISSAWIDSTSTSEDSYLAFSTRLASTIGEKVRIDNSGNVGIGTTGPGAKLEVVGSIFITSADAGLILADSYAAGNQVLTLNEGTGVWNIAATVHSSTTTVTNDIAFRLGNASAGRFEAMRITNAGNVGIGTTNPVTLLDVEKSQDTSTYISVGNVNTGTAAASGIYATNSAGNIALFRMTGTNYTASGYYPQAGAAFLTDGPGGFNIAATNAAGVLRFFTGGANQQMTILANGNVGIGTTGPVKPLEVKSETAIRSSRTSTSQYVDFYYAGLQGSATNDLYLIGGTGYGINFGANGATDKMVLTSSGNVGIGTTAPSAKLHISGDMRLTGALYDVNNGVGTSGQVLSSTVSGVDWVDITSVGIGGSGTTNYIPKFTASTTLGNSVLYETAGNVGIGTTGPGQKLDVQGTGGVIVNVGSSTNSGYAIFQATNDVSAFFQMGIWGSTKASWGAISSGDASLYGSTSLGIVAQGSTGSIKFGTGTSGTEWMRITSTGNVGIGTTGPSQKLDVNGSVRLGNIVGSGSYIGFLTDAGAAQNVKVGSLAITSSYSNSAPTNGAYIQGNVGIGTTSPLDKLVVAGNIDPLTDASYDLGDTTYSWRNLYLTGNLCFDDTDCLDSSATAGGWTDGGASVYLTTSADNVGIGTSTPLVKLHVVGDGTNTAAFMSGNVGIGTTSPGYALGVTGSVNLTTGNSFYINGASVLNATTLGTAVVTSSLTTVGVLGSGSIASGFGAIDTGTDNIITTGTMGVAANTVFTGLSQTLTGQFTSSYANAAAINLTGAGAGITFTGTGVDQLITAASQHLALMPGGNVGIGTTLPSSFKLETVGSIGPAANDSYDIGSAARIWNDVYVDRICFDGSADCMGSSSTAGGWTDDGSIVRLTTVGDLVGIGYADPGTAKLAINGNVGIGNTSPGYALGVTGSVNLTTGNAFYINGASVLNATTLGTAVVTSSLTTVGVLGSGSIASGFGAIDTGADNIITTGTMGVASNTVFTGLSQTLTGQFTSSYANAAALNLTGAEAGITFTNTGPNRIVTAASQHLALMPGGNVGIGTTLPSSFKLEAAGDIGPEATNTRNLGSASRYFNTIYVNNIVGTGALGYWNRSGTVLSPATAGDIVNIGDGTVALPAYSFTNDTDSGMYRITTDKLAFATAATARITIDSTGQVGIGTTGPGAKLDVRGGLNAGANGTEFTVSTAGVVTGGTYNLQTLSSAASFTGTINAVTGYKVNSAAASGNVLRGDGTNFVSATLAGSDITGAALTKADDTNVTMTLGGTPTTALLRAASLTLGWTGQLSLARGGTNKNMTASAGAVTYSDADSLELSAVGSSGQCLMSGASGAPTWGACSTGSVTGTGTDNYLARWNAAGTGIENATLVDNATTGISLNIDTGNNVGIGGTAASANPRLYVMAASGNVGIGTTGPETLLHINKSTTATTLGQFDAALRIQNTSATVNSGGEISFMGRTDLGASTATAVYAAITAPITVSGVAGTFGYLSLSTKAAAADTSLTERMRITSAGNVGIGTTNPSTFKLQLAGHVGPDAGSTYDLGNSSTRWRYLYVNDICFDGGTDCLTSSATAGGWTDDGSIVRLTTIGDLVGIGYADPGTAKLAINGNVGIGNTSPGYALGVTGSVNLTTGNAFYINAASVLNATTLGTAVVTSSLTTVGVLGSGSIASGFGAIDTGADNIITTGTMGVAANTVFTGLSQTLTGQFTSSYANAAAINLTGAGAGITFTGTGVDQIVTAASQHLALMPGGNVGIGTTLPSSFKLETVGSIGPAANDSYDLGSATRIWNDAYVDRICFDGSADCMGSSTTGGGWTDGGASVYLTTTADNVGIGTSTPLVKLHVVGDGTNTAAFMSGNVGIGTTSPGYALGVAGSVNLTTGNSFYINGASVLNATTLGTGVLTSSLTTVGVLGSGSIASGFGAIDTGADNIITTGTMGVAANTVFTGLSQTLTGQFTSSYANAAALNLTGAEAGITFTSTGPNRLVTAASQHLALMPGGNVGIGTTGPGAKLEVVGNLWVTKSLAESGHNFKMTWSGEEMYFDFNGTGAATGELLFRNENGVVMKMHDSGGVAIGDSYYATDPGEDKVIIEGNVGIGTTAPGYPLDVQAATAISNLTSTTGTNYAFLRVTNGTSGMYLGVERSTTGGLLSGSIPYAGILTTTTASPLQFGTNGSVNMTILSGGNVGIGTTNPAAKLDVGGGDIYGGTAYKIKIGYMTDAGNEAYGLDPAGTTNFGGYSLKVTGGALLAVDSGNVGIGTASPSQKLHVFGNGIASQILIDTSSGSFDPSLALTTAGATTEGLKLWYDASVGDVYFDSVYNSTAGDIHFRTKTAGTAVDALFIESAGNVGIGTTGPSSLLDVEGTGADLFELNKSSAGAAWMTLRSAGTVRGYLGFDAAAGGGLLSGSIGNSMVVRSENALHLVSNSGGATNGITITGGNVGIGTAGPGAKLDVVGLIRNSAPSVGTLELSGLLPGYADNTYPTVKSSGANIYFSTGGYYTGYIGNGGIFGMYTTGMTNNVQINASGTSWFNGGNVGIGTVGPGEKLEVYGNVKLSNATITTGVRALTPTGWGYSPNAYRVVQVGATSGTESVAIGYDPSGNASGSFTGDGREVLFRRGVQFVTPNAANTAFNLTNLVLLDGNVGIGTAGPGDKLKVYGSGVGTGITIGGDSYTARLSFARTGNPTAWIGVSEPGAVGTGELQFATGTATNPAVTMVIKDTGNVGIGTAGPLSKLSVGGVGDSIAAIYGTGASIGVYGYGTTRGVYGYGPKGVEGTGTVYGVYGAGDTTGVYGYGGTYDFYAANSSAKSYFAGIVGIGTAAPAGAVGDLNVVRPSATTTGAVFFGKDTPDHYLYFNGTQFHKNGDSGWGEDSDKRVKTDINTLSYGLKEILQLEPKKYIYHGGQFENGVLQVNPNGTPDIGLIAQDVYNVIPEAVTKPIDDSKELWSLNYTNFIPVLINAVKEQQTQIASLSGQLANLTLTDSGELKIIGQENNYTVTAADNTLIDRIGAFASLVAANIKAGFIETQEIISNLGNFRTLRAEVITPLQGDNIFITGSVEIQGNASVSGTLTANKIESSTIDIMRQKIEDIVAGLNQQTAIATAPATLDINTLNTLYELLNSHESATASAQSLDLASVQADFGFFKDYLAVLGQAVITDLTVTNNLSVASITSPTGSLNLLAGLMVLDQSGNVAINANLTVNGSILAQKVTAPQGHFEELLSQKLAVDEARIKKLTTDGLTIALPAESTPSAIATDSASIATNATAGKAILPAGLTELKIENSKIENSSMIYVTPIGDSQNQVLYVKSKQTCPEGSEPHCSPWFTIAINQPLPYDLEFNWWIIRLEGETI